MGVIEVVKFVCVRPVSVHSLAQQDSVLQTLHEVVSYLLASHVLNPQPQLLFLLGVVLPCELAGGMEQRSEVNQ